jgi:hypothetical protein
LCVSRRLAFVVFWSGLDTAQLAAENTPLITIPRNAQSVARR